MKASCRRVAARGSNRSTLPDVFDPKPHWLVVIEHLPQFGDILWASGFINRNSHGMFVQHAEIHPVSIRRPDDVGGRARAEADAQHIEERLGAEAQTQALQARA